METKLVERYIPAVYSAKNEEAADKLAKSLLFSENTYDDWENYVFTRRNTLYKDDGASGKKRLLFNKIEELAYADNDTDCQYPHFKFVIPEKLAEIIDKIEQPVIVCTAKIERDENGNPIKAKKPKYWLYSYQDYIEQEKRRIAQKVEKGVFRTGSVVPKNPLTSSVKERVDTTVKIDTVESEYKPVEPIVVEEQFDQNTFKQKVVEALKNMNVKPSFSL